VTHHIAFEWPDPKPFRDRGGAAIRLLVVSDAVDPTLMDLRNRQDAATSTAATCPSSQTD
jgi:hypothetical protein